MPARATTSNRAPARGGGSSRPRTGASTRKRPPAKRGSTAARRPVAKKQQSTLAGSLWRGASGAWGLLAKGAGGLARSVARPEEAEPLAPEHRRDGVGLAVLGLAIVLGAATWTDGIGPVGAGLADGVHVLIGGPPPAVPPVPPLLGPPPP